MPPPLRAVLILAALVAVLLVLGGVVRGEALRTVWVVG